MAAADDRTLELFGGPETPWNDLRWTDSDDRVRGGKSFSLFIGEGEPIRFVTFSGYLDTAALAGPDGATAAFASHRTIDSYSAPDLSGYDALVLDVPRSDGKKYTLVLKDLVGTKRPDGRETSTLSWEHDFHCPGHRGSGRVVLHFSDFQPFYRGKRMPEAGELDRGNIRRITIMMRSFFGEQEGDFALALLSITAYRYQPKSITGLTGLSSEGGVLAEEGGQPEARDKQTGFLASLAPRWLRKRRQKQSS
ncbi:complex I intermediate-associated protein 30-domain-containing protein [Lasiosphaeris hirsuta]|uniref:Complex I intermediate-associated protein 30-domain-containing protein n=1 Tax=Lasiosphaeris hirsuta TaxID=260670 RepID=A0AA40A2X9_9PEZI|nr:complex I intermediate-associated protein 30-domain-containing protein [Lasiosphaeris hirsuta]